MTSQSAINQRAMIAFCWLPPLNFRISRSICIGRSATRLRNSAESLRIRDRETMPRCANRRRTDRVTLAATDRKGMIPSRFRSSGTRPMPRRAAAARDLKLIVSPRKRMVPASGFSNPARRRTISVRPAPTRPAIPSTSPRRIETETSRTRSRHLRFLASSKTSPAFLRACLRNSISLPTISAMISDREHSSIRISAIRRPSRRIVAVSQTLATSSSLCET